MCCRVGALRTHTRRCVQVTNADQWTLRVEPAAALRLAAKFGWHESVANHFSAAVSGDGKQLLLNPRWQHFASLRARELLRLARMLLRPCARSERLEYSWEFAQTPRSCARIAALSFALHYRVGGTYRRHCPSHLSEHGTLFQSRCNRCGLYRHCRQ